MTLDIKPTWQNTLYDEGKYTSIEAIHDDAVNLKFPLYAWQNTIYVTDSGEPSTYDPGDY